MDMENSVGELVGVKVGNEEGSSVALLPGTASATTTSAVLAVDTLAVDIVDILI